eukprot:365659-Chlamydomonas_euryale.AAC.1
MPSALHAPLSSFNKLAPPGYCAPTLFCPHPRALLQPRPIERPLALPFSALERLCNQVSVCSNCGANRGFGVPSEAGACGAAVHVQQAGACGAAVHVQQADAARIQQANPAHIQQADTAHVQQADTAHIQQAETAHIQQADTAHIQQADTAHIQQADPAHIQQAETAHIQQASTAHIQQASAAHIQQAVQKAPFPLATPPCDAAVPAPSLRSFPATCAELPEAALDAPGARRALCPGVHAQPTQQAGLSASNPANEHAAAAASAAAVLKSECAGPGAVLLHNIPAVKAPKEPYCSVYRLASSRACLTDCAALEHANAERARMASPGEGVACFLV